MEDSDVLPPPFWQPPATLTQRHRRRASSPLLNSSIMIILLPTFSLLFIVLVVVPSISRILPHANNKRITTNSSPSPPIHNHNHNHNHNNNKSISLKTSWDSINIILVVFAILCGIFAKRNDNLPSSSSTGSHSQQIQPQACTTSASASASASASFLLQRSKSVIHQHQQSSSVPQWFDHYSQAHHHRILSSPVNTSPTPTMLRRTVSSDPYMRDTGPNQFRFLDDLDASRFYPKEESQPQPQPFESIPQVDGRVKDIPVDTFVLRNREELPSPPQTPPQEPPTPSPPPAKERRTFQTIPRREQPQSSDHPPSPLPPSDHRQKRSSRKRTTKDIATAIVSLYSHGKRKRRLKPTRNHTGPQTLQAQSQFASPPSPPPPPPPSVFHNLFKKTKKIHSMSSIPTPPPPPPPSRHSKPPLPTRRERGNESPMNGIPPPTQPPPPPFKVSEMKFAVVGGGFVRVQSAQSQRCESPEIDDGKGGTEERVASCPSPDVNLKADTFIARHHNGWRLEKLKSWREKHTNNQATTTTTTTTTTKAADLIGSHSHNQFLRTQ